MKIQEKETTMHMQACRKHFIYNARIIPEISDQLFEQQDLLFEQQEGKSGRGRPVFFEYKQNNYVLKHYYRGGALAGFLTDRYIWTGLSRTRPWREWRLLKYLHQQGFPVPEPIVARVVQTGFFYTADIVTRAIPQSLTLSKILKQEDLSSRLWEKIGACISLFHKAGIKHADLNAHNILIDKCEQVWLVDFDKGYICKPERSWQDKNIQRLQRSLQKLLQENQFFNFNKTKWQILTNSYLSERSK